MPQTLSATTVRSAIAAAPHPQPLVVDEIELTPVGATANRLTAAEIAQAQDPQWPSRRSLFVLTVIVPMVVICVYLFFVAAPRYVSQASFIVRSVQPGASGFGQVAALVEGSSYSRADDETYAVNAFIQSRDMVAQLVERDHLRDVLSRPEADPVNRFPNLYRSNTLEQLFRHFQQYVGVDTDSNSGLSTLSVQAFTPEDAQALAAAIIAHSEELVNRMNKRAFADAEAYAESVVDAAKNHVDAVEAQLTDLRAKTGVVDPTQEAEAALTLIQGLSKELNAQETELRREATLTPQSAALDGLKQKIESLRTQIDQERQKVVGSDGSLAARMGEFDKLTLDRVVASAELQSAVETLVKARQDSHQQHLYLETITAPRPADEALYPRRTLWTILSLLACLAIFTIADTIFANVREHRS